MATESERSRERAAEGSREDHRERTERRDRSGDVIPAVERGLATADPALIEVARDRARALAAGETVRKEEKDEERPIFDFATRAKDMGKKVGKGGLKVMGGSLLAFTYLGYQTSRPVLFTAAHALDWIGHKMNSWADKLIDKKIPILSWFLNPMISVLDSFAKKLGIDKTLAEHLKKNADDRKKLAQKVLEDYMNAQKAAEKKMDDAAAKARRHKVLEEKLGPDVAAVILDDLDAAAAAASSKVSHAPVAAPHETPKTT